MIPTECQCDMSLLEALHPLQKVSTLTAVGLNVNSSGIANLDYPIGVMKSLD